LWQEIHWILGETTNVRCPVSAWIAKDKGLDVSDPLVFHHIINDDIFGEACDRLSV
jgi:hypothetical protein